MNAAFSGSIIVHCVRQIHCKNFTEAESGKGMLQELGVVINRGKFVFVELSTVQ